MPFGSSASYSDLLQGTSIGNLWVAAQALAPLHQIRSIVPYTVLLWADYSFPYLKNNNMTFQEIINQDKPVLVDFFAEWCGPCKMMAPVLQKVKSSVGDAATIIKIDVDKNPQVAATHHVQGVPTLMLFKEGKLLWRQSGVVPPNELEKVIRNHIVSS